MDYLIIGNKNAIIYKEVFPCIKNNQLWLGITKPDIFNTPSGAHTEKLAGLTRWFTNLTSDYERKPLVLTKRYTPDEYHKYDNYDAIEVPKVKDIPVDYDGVMGVPITFLDKYCNSQFEIVGIGCGNSWNNYREELEALGFDPEQKYGGGLGAPILNGKAVYARLIIKLKRPPVKDGQSNPDTLTAGSKPPQKYKK